MSGKCTGWVGEHGPHPDDIDREGKKYGARARGMRLVLLAVADSANVDGQHSHPGIANVARFSLYSAGQCRRTLEELEAEGWLVVTEQGGGRGRATVYTVPMDLDALAERRASRAPLAGGNARTEPTQTRAPATETRAPATDSRASGCAPNGVTNGVATETTNGPTSPPAADDPARVVAKAVWEARTPRPAQPFIAIVKIADALLAAGHEPAVIERAMLAVPTISTRWVEAEINRSRPAQARRPVEDRSAPSGRIEL